MRAARHILAVIAGLGVCTSAHAFQESEAPTATGQKQSELRDAGKSQQQKTDTVLSVPGLGKLGVIPKLDFGLDLLYGQDAAKADPVETLPNDDGLRIRGSIRHRF